MSKGPALVRSTVDCGREDRRRQSGLPRVVIEPRSSSRRDWAGFPQRVRNSASGFVNLVTAMRLWSLHPSLLDRVGLVALWREGLLAQKVLLGQTTGYRFHPQLKRFRAYANPVAVISTYLWGVIDESTIRGYKFDASKIVMSRRRISMPVNQGQLEFERLHLRKKLRSRDREWLRRLEFEALKPHPMLRVVPGRVESWEAL